MRHPLEPQPSPPPAGTDLAAIPGGSPLQTARRGAIIAIGGAEEKVRRRAVLRRVAEACGGADARLVIIPTASQLPEMGARYLRVFRDLGLRAVQLLPIESRADCRREDWLALLAEATGVFMTGGNQLRLSTTIGGTPVSDLLRRRNRQGLVVAGTSAGAAILSEHMIAFGDDGATPRADMVRLAPGLGLIPQVVVDQHFRQRDRLGRLITAVTYNPALIGIGLDEDTAAVIGPDDVLEVVGSGAITVIDPAGLGFSSIDSAKRQDPVCVLNLRLHVLTHGGRFDLRSREPAIPIEAAQP